MASKNVKWSEVTLVCKATKQAWNVSDKAMPVWGGES